MENFVGRVTFVLILFAAGTVYLLAQTVSQGSEKIPDPVTLLQAASAKEDAFAIERQKYLCVFKNKKFTTQTVRLYESFYIHGHEIQRLLAVNDLPLSAKQKRAEESRVEKEVAADQKKRIVPFVGLAGGMYVSRGEHRWAQSVEGSIVRAGIFNNERKVMYRGRPAIQIDFVGNSTFKAHTDEERVAKVLSGTIIVDEESGAIVRVGAEAMSDAYHGKKLLNNLLFGHGARIGFDAVKVADNLYLPSSWVSYHHYIIDPDPQPLKPASWPDTEDFWLQGCRKYTSEVRILPEMTPVQ